MNLKKKMYQKESTLVCSFKYPSNTLQIPFKWIVLCTYHGGWRSRKSVIESWHYRMGWMANIPPLLASSVFTFKNIMYRKLNLRQCSTPWWIYITQLYFKNMWTHNWYWACTKFMCLHIPICLAFLENLNCTVVMK